jgi:hypothetical protein
MYFILHHKHSIYSGYRDQMSVDHGHFIPHHIVLIHISPAQNYASRECSTTPAHTTPLAYAHVRTEIYKYSESHSAQESAGACVLCLNTEPKHS